MYLQPASTVPWRLPLPVRDGALLNSADLLHAGCQPDMIFTDSTQQHHPKITAAPGSDLPDLPKRNCPDVDGAGCCCAGPQWDSRRCVVVTPEGKLPSVISRGHSLTGPSVESGAHP